MNCSFFVTQIYEVDHQETQHFTKITKKLDHIDEELETGVASPSSSSSSRLRRAEKTCPLLRARHGRDVTCFPLPSVANRGRNEFLGKSPTNPWEMMILIIIWLYLVGGDWNMNGL
jgi:hypothetical protein